MQKEFFVKLKLHGMEYNALELEQLIWRALLLENPKLPLEIGLKNDITVAPIEYYDLERQRINRFTIILDCENCKDYAAHGVKHQNNKYETCCSLCNYSRVYSKQEFDVLEKEGS